MTDAGPAVPRSASQGGGADATAAAAGAEAGAQARAEAGAEAGTEAGGRLAEAAASRTGVTLQDVADRAGVSLTTASRVLSDGPRRVGRQLVHRVNQAVDELGYTANLQARAVATGQSNMVGVVVHDISDPYFSSIAAGLIEVAERQRLLVCLSSTAAGEAGERQYVALMRSQRARAVIVIGSRTDDQARLAELRNEIRAFGRSGGRAVCIGQDLLGVDTILPENAAGAEALGRALVVQGHRRFAVLAGPRGLLTARDRLTGFLGGLAGLVGQRRPALHRARGVQPRRRLRSHERDTCARPAASGLCLRGH